MLQLALATVRLDPQILTLAGEDYAAVTLAKAECLAGDSVKHAAKVKAAGDGDHDLMQRRKRVYLLPELRIGLPVRPRILDREAKLAGNHFQKTDFVVGKHPAVSGLHIEHAQCLLAGRRGY